MMGKWSLRQTSKVYYHRPGASSGVQMLGAIDDIMPIATIFMIRA